jgi:hypothetical protein
MRSLGVAGAEYQSVMMTPPNGSAEAKGMKAIVSSEARHRKELTPNVMRLEPLAMAVVPVSTSLAALSEELQPARTRAQSKKGRIRIGSLSS